MKHILMIGTGGTIASDITDSGLTPELSTEDLLRQVPGLEKLCRVDCLQVCSLDSTNTVSYTHLQPQPDRRAL